MRGRAARSVILALVVTGALLAVVQAFAQPVPTPQPGTLSIAVKDLMTEMPEKSFYERATTWVVNILGSNPWIIPVILLAVLTTNGLRSRWPNRADRPGWVLFILGCTDPITGNFWSAIAWVSNKTGIPIWRPKGDSTDEIPLPEKPLPPDSVARAIASRPDGGGGG